MNVTSLARLAAQTVRSAAPNTDKKISQGKTEMTEIFEDIFHRLPQDDNGPTDRSRELGKVNYLARAPSGMNDWDFEYTEDSMNRSSTGSLNTFTELRVADKTLELISADSYNGRGSVTRTVYESEKDQSVVETWNFHNDSSTVPSTLTLLPEPQLKLSLGTGSPEENAAKRTKIAGWLKALSR